MLNRLFSRDFSSKRKIQSLKENGVMLGSRLKNRRKYFFYMLDGSFLEVLFENDQPHGGLENVKYFKSLEKLNAYMEQEFHAAIV